MKSFFWTKNRNDAVRLLPIVAKNNGGLSYFDVKQNDENVSSQRRGGYFLCFDDLKYAKNHPKLNIDYEYAHSKCLKMLSYLQGYLDAESARNREIVNIEKARELRRQGKKYV